MSSLGIPTWKMRRLGWAEWITSAVLVLIALAAVQHSRHYAGVTIDDAFITFRHALNWTRGRGFTCNPGERIEGTSSALFGMLMVLPIALGADPYHAAAVLGSMAFAGCTWAAYLTVRVCLAERTSRALGVGAAAWVASSSSLAFHSQTGMETLPYCCLLAWGLWLHLRAILRGRGSRAWAVVMAMAAAARPEGLAFFLMLWLAGVAARPRSPGIWVRRELAVFLGVYGSWQLLRLAYFGSIVPNPVLAKSGAMSLYVGLSNRERLDLVLTGPGTQLLGEYASEHWVATVLLVGMLMLRRTRYAGLLIVSIALACGALTTCGGGDWMPHRRLLMPAVVPLAVGGVLGLRGFLFHPEQRTALGHLPSLVLSVICSVPVVTAARRPLRMDHTALVDREKVSELGRRLGRLTHREDVVASELAGVLPYYWDTPVLDMFGLCDAHIARRGKPQPFGAGRVDPKYVLDRQPTFLVFDHSVRAALYYQDAAFASLRQSYHLLQYPAGYPASFIAGTPPVLFVRKDWRDLGRLVRELDVTLVDPGEALRGAGLLGS